MSSISIPYLSLVSKRDPDFYKDRSAEPEYEFSNGRFFYADRSKRGAYNPAEAPLAPGNAPAQVVTGT